MFFSFEAAIKIKIGFDIVFTFPIHIVVYLYSVFIFITHLIDITVHSRYTLDTHLLNFILLFNLHCYLHRTLFLTSRQLNSFKLQCNLVPTRRMTRKVYNFNFPCPHHTTYSISRYIILYYIQLMLLFYFEIPSCSR